MAEIGGIEMAWIPAALLSAAAVAFGWGYAIGRRAGGVEGAARRALELRAESLANGRCAVCSRMIRPETAPAE